jgi:hypothetical protein
VIFVLTDKNASEPAGVLPLWQNSGGTPEAFVLRVLADVIQFCGKLLALSVKCCGRFGITIVTIYFVKLSFT